jgi:DNA polymerase-4
MTLRSLHIDMNSFFASCEQQVHPELRGKPVAVVGVDTESTACLAASREAKRFGVKTNVGVREAKAMCPGLIIRVTDTALYTRTHYAVHDAVETVWPVHKTWSIDEFECALTGPQQQREQAERLARRIKRAIARQVGECLTCSIGIGPNQLLAKLGTELQKPDGLQVIEQHTLPQRLYPIKITELVGIGPAMEQRLYRAGITSFEQLCALSEPQCIALWRSVEGSRIYRALRGETYLTPREVKRSIGHQHVLAPPYRTIDGAWGVLVKLLAKAGERARRYAYIARKMVLWVMLETQEQPAGPGWRGDRIGMGWSSPGRAHGSAPRGATGTGFLPSLWNGRAGWSWERVIDPPCNDTLQLINCLPGRDEWRAMTRGLPMARPRVVGVSLIDLEPEACATLPLFVPAKPRDRASHAMDKINEKFGRDTIYPAAMQDFRTTAPRRIAFRSVPGREELQAWEKAQEVAKISEQAATVRSRKAGSPVPGRSAEGFTPHDRW